MQLYNIYRQKVNERTGADRSAAPLVVNNKPLTQKGAANLLGELRMVPCYRYYMQAVKKEVTAKKFEYVLTDESKTRPMMLLSDVIDQYFEGNIQAASDHFGKKRQQVSRWSDESFLIDPATGIRYRPVLDSIKT